MQEQRPQSVTAQCPDELRIHDAKEALKKLTSVRDMSPRELFQQLEKSGYVGQEESRRRLCLMAYRHIRRLKDHFIKHMSFDSLPPKSNVLMAGPTGCGKSHLAELLFGKILQIPVTTVDITGFVETGYMGRQVGEILYDLLMSAEGNSYWAKMGICVLDEFDKIASTGSHIRFGGAGTTKDVSGLGVQRGLLKLIEGGEHQVSSKQPWGNQVEEHFDTDCIGFVACGAFSGIKELAKTQQTGDFGFRPGTRASEQPHNESISVEVFSRYGFLPELIGRFTSIAHLSPLTKEDLTTILKKNVLPKYRQEFKREGQRLVLPKKVMEEIIEMALERRTGARGISLLLTEYFEGQAFECFGQGCADCDIDF